MKPVDFAPSGDTVALLKQIQKFQADVIGNKLRVVKVPVREVAYVPMLTEDAQKVYFNAGRYAMGARDKVAVTAWQKYELTEQA